MTFDQFAAQHTRALLRLAAAMCGDVHLAEDVVQDVLLKVHLRWGNIEQLDDPPSYVRRMVANEYFSWRRKWSRVVPFADTDIFERQNETPDIAITLADRAELTQRLARLTRRQRAVLALRYYEGMSDAEIAQALGCGEGSVRSHASRGLSALRITEPDTAPRATARVIDTQLKTGSRREH